MTSSMYDNSVDLESEESRNVSQELQNTKKRVKRQTREMSRSRYLKNFVPDFHSTVLGSAAFGMQAADEDAHFGAVFVACKRNA